MKTTFKNRSGENIVAVVTESEHSLGVVFIEHGLSGTKDQPQIIALAQAFNECNYTAVTFDTRNTFGESSGKYEDITVTGAYEDLEDVIEWSRSQSWFKEPFVLAGHSQGGYCVAKYAETYPSRVKALAPLSTVVSGKLTGEAWGDEFLSKWKQSGWWD